MCSSISISSQPMPYLLSCGHKVFSANEVHCTRNPSYFVLILMKSGTLRFAEADSEVTLTPNLWYIQRQGVPHTGTSPCPDAAYFYIHFSGTHFTKEEQGAQFVSLPLSGRFYYPAYQEMIDMVWQYHSSGPWNQLSLQSAFLNLLARLYHDNMHINPQAKQILDYIKANYQKRITSATLSKVFNFSEKYIERIVKEQFSITPHQYLTLTRLENAKILLDQTNIPLKEIAETCGFTDPSLFYRAFFKSNDISPSNWRKKAMNIPSKD